MLERIKMLLDVGRLLGEEKMFSLVKPEEAWEMYQFINKTRRDTNVTSQGYCGDKDALECYNITVELVSFGWDLVNALRDYCWNLWYNTKVEIDNEDEVRAIYEGNANGIFTNDNEVL